MQDPKTLWTLTQREHTSSESCVLLFSSREAAEAWVGRETEAMEKDEPELGPWWSVRDGLRVFSSEGVEDGATVWDNEDVFWVLEPATFVE